MVRVFLAGGPASLNVRGSSVEIKPSRASTLGVIRTSLSELVSCKRGISPEMALRLSKAFGGSPESQLTQQAHYDLAHLRTAHIRLKRLQVA